MKNVIPFTKEIKFDNKISEITSISLEENYNSTSDTIDGEFIVSGDYRTHELSVNRENFEYKLPFSVDLTEKINPDTLNFEITDFSYDILNDDTLKVNIEFKIDAEKEEAREEVFHEVDELLNNEQVISDLIEEVKEQEDKDNNNEREDIEELQTEENGEERLNIEEENTILDSINQDENEYTTYHIHIVKEAETIESICALYNSDTTLLAEYNDLNEFKVGEKLIVVEKDE